MPGAISISLSSPDDLEGPQRAAVRQGRDRPGVPVGQERCRVEAVAGAVDVADRDHVAVGAVRIVRALAAWLCVSRGSLWAMSSMRGLAAGRDGSENRAAGRGEAAPEKATSAEDISKPYAHSEKLASLVHAICIVTPSWAMLKKLAYTKFA